MNTSHYLHHKLLLFLFLILSSIVIGCSSKDSKLEETMKFAGENRAELQKVLDHYADDSLKLAAAHYLISNMKDKYGYDDPVLDTIESKLQPLQLKKMNFFLSEEERDYWRAYDFSTMPKVYDAQSISADYLIKNIDLAFQQWQERPWNSTLSFEDFCELLLPYRIADERLSDWREVYLNQYGHALDSLYQGDNAVEACQAIVKYIQDGPYWLSNYDIPGPHRDACALSKCRVGTTQDDSDRMLYIMRACGIPVSIDQVFSTPPYTYTNNMRQWNVVFDPSTKRYHTFSYLRAPSFTRPLNDGELYGMVHRISYENTDPKDVSADYFGKNEVIIPLNEKVSDIELGTFYNGVWNAVGKGQTKGKKAIFRNIQDGVFYAPIHIVDGEVKILGAPFTYIDEKAHIFDADTTNMETIKVNRLNMMTPKIASFRHAHMAGAVILASNSPNFSNADILLSISDDGLDNLYNKFIIDNNNKKYSYIRYQLPKGKHVHIAELSLYSDKEGTQSIPMEIYTKMDPQFAPECMIDGSTKWTFTAADDVNFIDLKMSSPSQIQSIVVVPANDTQDIWPGIKYELLYLDGTNGWKLLETKEAYDGVLEFQAPHNALLWVRKLGETSHGRAFFYKFDAQQWKL